MYDDLTFIDIEGIFAGIEPKEEFYQRIYPNPARP